MIVLSKFETLIESFDKILQGEDEILLLGYNVECLVKSLEKAQNEA